MYKLQSSREKSLLLFLCSSSPSVIAGLILLVIAGTTGNLFFLHEISPFNG